MRELGLLLSVISMIIGLLLLMAPKILIQLGDKTNKLYNIDGYVYRNRYLFGGFLVVAGTFLIYTTI